MANIRRCTAVRVCAACSCCKSGSAPKPSKPKSNSTTACSRSTAALASARAVGWPARACASKTRNATARTSACSACASRHSSGDACAVAKHARARNRPFCESTSARSKLSAKRASASGRLCSSAAARCAERAPAKRRITCVAGAVANSIARPGALDAVSATSECNHAATSTCRSGRYGSAATNHALCSPASRANSAAPVSWSPSIAHRSVRANARSNAA